MLFVVLGLLAQCLLISKPKMFLLAYGLANGRPNKEAKIWLCADTIFSYLRTHRPMHTNCLTAQDNPNPDIRHFKAERCCNSYCAM